jgi:hypothetical protein
MFANKQGNSWRHWNAHSEAAHGQTFPERRRYSTVSAHCVVSAFDQCRLLDRVVVVIICLAPRLVAYSLFVLLLFGDEKVQSNLQNLLVFQVMGSLFRLRNVTVVGYFYYLILLKLLHVSVVRPSSGRNILARTTRLTTDPLFFFSIVTLRRRNKAPITWISHTQQDANTPRLRLLVLLRWR